MASLSKGIQLRAAGRGTILASTAAVAEESISGGEEPGDTSVPGVRLNTNRATMYINFGSDTLQLIATVEPADAANQNVSWTSSNELVATVDTNGLVTIHALGNATITVTTKEGSYQDYCLLTVTAYSAPSQPSTDRDDVDDDSCAVSDPSSSSIKNGSMNVSLRSAERGGPVTITVRPDSGYELDELTVTSRNSGSARLTQVSGTQYTFNPGANCTRAQTITSSGGARRTEKEQGSDQIKRKEGARRSEQVQKKGQ